MSTPVEYFLGEPTDCEHEECPNPVTWAVTVVLAGERFTVLCCTQHLAGSGEMVNWRKPDDLIAIQRVLVRSGVAALT